MKIPKNYHQGLSQWVSTCRSLLEGQGYRGSYQDLSADILERTRRRVSPDSLRKWEVGGFVDADRRITHEKEEMIALYCSAIGLPTPDWLPSGDSVSVEWSVESIRQLPAAEVAAIVAIGLERLEELGYVPQRHKPETRQEFELWLLNNIELAHTVTGIEKPRLIQMSQGEVTLSDFALISCKIFKVDDASWFFRLYPEHQPAKDSPAQGNEKSPNRDKKKKPRQPQA